ncbi:DUF411 domain-containing protein [Lysobacter sp. A3-1-A15]|uniref:DUF411 domain-containing protein n=1 Tax=Novilysobacter viscosus TaxID=3098602 RepID=UPI002ED8681A
MKHPTTSIVALVLAGAAMTACARAPETACTVAEPATPVTQAAPEAAQVTEASVVHVHKSASCGCCTLWVDHMREAGFTVEVTDSDDVGAVKERVGVPLGKGSCHTAEVGGYFIEGHVPAGDVRRLLAERPDAKGLVLPGMPAGSPGMEMPDGRTQPYTVELVHRDGTTTEFSRHQQTPEPSSAANDGT